MEGTSSSPSAPMSSDPLAAAATMSPASVPASLGSETAPSPAQAKHNLDLALSADYVARTLAGTSVYTVSNSFRSLGIFCFRKEDAQTLLAQGSKVVPIVLDQVYMLKVEGIAFRFLPDPLQIKNALTLWSADISQGLDGVPVFQSDLLIVKKKNKRHCPIYFQKVGSFEDVLKKMEMNDKNSGRDDLLFIPPGKSYTQHINEVAICRALIRCCWDPGKLFLDNSLRVLGKFLNVP